MIEIDFRDIAPHLIVSDAIVCTEYIEEEIEIVEPLETTFFQMRQFLIKDNNGYVLCFGEEA